MKTTIEYYKKNVYGNDLMYVKDKTQAEIITGLTGQKTISPYIMEALKKLVGCEFKQVLPD